MAESNRSCRPKSSSRSRRVRRDSSASSIDSGVHESPEKRRVHRSATSDQGQPKPHRHETRTERGTPQRSSRETSTKVRRRDRSSSSSAEKTSRIKGVTRQRSEQPSSLLAKPSKGLPASSETQRTPRDDAVSRRGESVKSYKRMFSKKRNDLSMLSMNMTLMSN